MTNTNEYGILFSQMGNYVIYKNDETQIFTILSKDERHVVKENLTVDEAIKFANTVALELLQTELN